MGEVSHDVTGWETGTGFVHLHLHTEFSLLDGGNRIDRLVARVKELGMPAVAMTDHGNLFGAVSFHDTCKKHGVKPILGCEAYVAPHPHPRTSREKTGIADGGHHLVLLAENATGWANLMTLASEAYLTGFYYKPRIDRELLEQHNAGLIAINGHLGSELAYHLEKFVHTNDTAHWQHAIDVARWHMETFKDEGTGPRFFVELQQHIPEQSAINPHLIKLARELDLPLVCDNDAHFLNADEHDAHDTLVCISTGKTKADTARMRYPTELYVKGPEQMREIFRAHMPDVADEACDNTLKIAERCNVDLEFGNHAPMVRVGMPGDSMTWDGKADRGTWFKAFCARYEVLPIEDAGSIDHDQLRTDCDRTLRELCEAGLVWRYGKRLTDAAHADFAEQVRARLDRELKILSDKEIAAYFLIVWDFVNWARQHDIPALARGSGVGTMVGFLLGLSNACPVRFGLLFERFTDPDRSEYPDIDIDLCQDGRGAVIEYVRQKYGHVAQIITFGTLKARAAIRDVGRVMEMPLNHTDTLAKLVPEAPKMTFARAMAEEPTLKALYDADRSAYKEVFKNSPDAPDASTVRRIIDTGMVLEGQPRHASVHAAGVIVATRPLHEVVPLYRPPGTDDVVTQWDGPTCEQVGLLKMDFLGLRTLSVVERAITLIKESLPEDAIRAAVPETAEDPLDLEQLAYDDPTVFELFRRGDTTGVFQFESGGMRRLLQQMKPDRLEDLIAANALFRPGPMDLIPTYNARKHGQEQVPSLHPIVSKFTSETYGIMVYQEQVMQIVHELGGIPLRAAYSLIKAISKKKASIIDANRAKFIDGAQERGLSKKEAEDLFDLILKFAGYGFNKSHSTGYAIVAYRTAYLKTYFPTQYMAAFLTYESAAQKVDDWIGYLEDCRRTLKPDGTVGVEVRPPDVNLSESDFAVVFEEDEPRTSTNGHVRFGLRAIKGVGASAIHAVVKERNERGPYASLHDFCERVPPGGVNKSAVQSLICCGAFDNVHSRAERAAMAESVESAMAAGQTLAKDRAAGQGALFGGGGGDETADAAAEEAVVALASAEPWSEAEMLAREKSTLGFYVSAHPLDAHAAAIERFADTNTATLREKRQESGVIVGALVKSVRHVTTRKGDHMAILTLEDRLGVCDAVLFPRTYSTCAKLCEADRAVFALGTADHTRGDSQVIIDKLIPVERAEQQLASAVEIRVDESRLNGTSIATLELLRGDIDQSAHDTGNPAQLRLVLDTEEQGTVVVEPRQATAILTPDRLERWRSWFGEHNITITDRVRAKAKEQYQRRGPQQRELGNKEMCASVDRV